MSKAEDNYLIDIFCTEQPYPDMNDIKRLKQILLKMGAIIPSNLSKQSVNDQQKVLCGLLKAHKSYIKGKCIREVLSGKKKEYITLDMGGNETCVDINELYKEVTTDEKFRNTFSPAHLLKISTLHKVLNNPEEYECHYYSDYPEMCKGKILKIDSKDVPECTFKEAYNPFILSFMKKDKDKCVVNKDSLTLLKKQCGENSKAEIKKMLLNLFMELLNNEFETRIQNEVSLSDFYKIREELQIIYGVYSANLKNKSISDICSDLSLYTSESSLFDSINKEYKEISKIGITKYAIQNTNLLLHMVGSLLWTPADITEFFTLMKINLSPLQAEVITLCLNITSVYIEVAYVSWSTWFMLFPGGRKAIVEMFKNPVELSGFLVMLELSMSNQDLKTSEAMFKHLVGMVHNFGVDVPSMTEILGEVSFADALKSEGALLKFAISKMAPKIVNMGSKMLGDKILKNIQKNLDNMKGVKNMEKVVAVVAEKGLAGV